MWNNRKPPYSVQAGGGGDGDRSETEKVKVKENV
jgi:hypothetical protein